MWIDQIKMNFRKYIALYCELYLSGIGFVRFGICVEPLDSRTAKNVVVG